MWDILDNYNDDVPKHKLLFTLNGKLDSAIITLEFSLISMNDIKRKAESSYNIELDRLRLYTQQGVEIFEEDLMFMKDGTLLYISDSRDFDAYSQFSVYQIIKTLGEGGFGKVMLGKHKLTNEMVAIKIIDSGKLWNAADIDLVFREAEVMKNLRHKNIIKILNCYTLPSMQVVLIMEFLEGGDLVDYIQTKGRLSEDEARIIFKQIADAICYCHDQKLIHRDLKLENILLTSKTDKEIKIIDFGIATVATNFLMDKLDLGSLSYMPPEVLTGQIQQIRPSIDIWALGVILYALVCGTLPFNRPQQEQTIQNIIRCNYQFPNIALSKEYKDLVQLMLNPDPNERYSAYQVLGHNWMKKSGNTLQTPIKVFSKGVIKRDYTKVSSKKMMLSSVAVARDYTCLAQGKSTLSLKADRESPNSPNLIICESPDLIQRIKQFDSPKGEIIEVAQDHQISNPPTPMNRKENRKYSNFNQKLIDRIFKEDDKKVKKHTLQTQCATHALNSPKSRESNDLFSMRIHSKQSSLDLTKRVKSKQVKLRTIINLSQLTDLKQLYCQQMNKKENKKITLTEQTDNENLYKLQLSFRHRKMNSDSLLQKTFRSDGLRISDLYRTLFRV